jgi:hypothetical protein
MADPKNDPLRHVTLPEFPRAAQAGSVEVPPPVHSTTAVNIFDIIDAGSLVAAKCDVFAKEKLTVPLPKPTAVTNGDRPCLASSL